MALTTAHVVCTYLQIDKVARTEHNFARDIFLLLFSWDPIPYGLLVYSFRLHSGIKGVPTMKNQGKFSARSLATMALVAAATFGGAMLAAAQRESATPGEQTRDRQETIRSKPSTPVFKTLVNFDGTNGTDPNLSPIQGTDGNLYGGTALGGENSEGVLFKMTPSGKLTTIYNFCTKSGCPDGEGGAPEVLGSDGNFYGSNANGGAFGDGTVFKFTEKGVLTTLHTFDGTDGSFIKHLVQSSTATFAEPRPLVATSTNVTAVAVELSLK